MILFFAYHFYITHRSGVFTLEELLEEEEPDNTDLPKIPKPKLPDIFYIRPPSENPTQSVESPPTETQTIRMKPAPVWSLEEMSLLAKAMAKYPGGSTGRWEKITEMINTISNRTQKEVILKCREFDLQTQRLGKEEAYRRYLDTKQSRFSSKDDSSTLTTENPIPIAPTKLEDNWTSEQQKAFELALRTAGRGEDRWDQIASLVPGKSKQECIARFKEIRAKIIAQKGNK